MTRFILKRLLLAIFLMWGVVTLVFILIEIAPGDLSDYLMSDIPTTRSVEEKILERTDEDKTALQRYGIWFSKIIQGDLGYSFSRSRKVSDLVLTALPPTLLLSGLALFITVLLGTTLGMLAARNRGRMADRVITSLSLLIYGMPSFWVGLMAMLVFGHWLGWFPLAGMRSLRSEGLTVFQRVLDIAWHVALPAAVLGIGSAVAFQRFVRAGVIDAAGEWFMRSAKARGISSTRYWLHALRVTATPLINLIGLSLPVLVSGSLIIEVIFAWPGMGKLTYDAILTQDVPVVLATTLLSSGMVVFGNTLADLGMAWADPRILKSSRRGAS